MDQYPPVAFAFKVKLHGDNASGDMGFQEASGLSVSMGVEKYTEGGNNAFSLSLPTCPTYQNLSLKRGYVLNELPIFQWCRQTINSRFAKPIKPRQLTVTLLKADSSQATLKSWSFYRAWPVRWNLGEFQSQNNQVLIESLEFAYDYFDNK